MPSSPVVDDRVVGCLRPVSWWPRRVWRLPSPSRLPSQDPTFDLRRKPPTSWNLRRRMPLGHRVVPGFSGFTRPSPCRQAKPGLQPQSRRCRLASAPPSPSAPGVRRRPVDMKAWRSVEAKGVETEQAVSLRSPRAVVPGFSRGLGLRREDPAKAQDYNDRLYPQARKRPASPSGTFHPSALLRAPGVCAQRPALGGPKGRRGEGRGGLSPDAASPLRVRRAWRLHRFRCAEGAESGVETERKGGSPALTARVVWPQAPRKSGLAGFSREDLNTGVC
jgi:hypothetical protein